MGGGNWRMNANPGETFDEFVERLRPERETQPTACSHCGTEDVPLTNYSRTHGFNVGAHWLCDLCENTVSASRLGAGADDRDQNLIDIIRCLHVMRGGHGDNPPPPVWIVWEGDTPSPPRFTLEGAIQTKAGYDDRRIAMYRGEWKEL